MNTLLHQSRLRSALLLPLIAVLAAACGGPAASPSGAPSPTASAAATPTASAPSPTGEAYQVEVRSSTYGDYLAGEDGRSLYLFANDSVGTSTCVDQCAQNWPPFTLEAGESAVAGSGVSGAIGTISRPDGTTQVTINGLPLYYFAADTAAGDVNGQGVNGIWFLAAPDGTPLNSPAANATANPASMGLPTYRY